MGKILQKKGNTWAGAKKLAQGRKEWIFKSRWRGNIEEVKDFVRYYVYRFCFVFIFCAFVSYTLDGREVKYETNKNKINIRDYIYVFNNNILIRR